MKEELDVWDSLLIRACKSNNGSVRRFRRIWAMRCALYYDHTDMRDVIEHLIELIDRLQLGTLTSFFRLFNSNVGWHENFIKTPIDPEHIMYQTAVQIIRHTEISKIPGYRSPTRFTKRRTKSED